jgi:hypothetical protein
MGVSTQVSGCRRVRPEVPSAPEPDWRPVVPCATRGPVQAMACQGAPYRRAAVSIWPGRAQGSMQGTSGKPPRRVPIPVGTPLIGHYSKARAARACHPDHRFRARRPCADGQSALGETPSQLTGVRPNNVSGLLRQAKRDVAIRSPFVDVPTKDLPSSAWAFQGLHP